MSAHLIEHLPSLLEAIVSGVLTLVGLLVEQAAVANVISGNAAVGLWEVWMGGVVLFVGVYLIGYRRLVPEWQGTGVRR